MTLLTIIQDASLRCNVPVVNAAFSSLEPAIKEMVAFAQDAGQDLSERWDWRNLKLPGEIIGDGVTTLWELPSDWQRIVPSDTPQVGPLVSNLYPLLPLIGPINDEVLNQFKTFPATPVRPVWRIISNSLEIWPALANGEIVTFTYISRNFILSPDGATRYHRWANDSDSVLMPEDLVMKGTVWRWKAAKGLDYAEEMRAAEIAADRRASQEGQTRTVRTSMSEYPFGPDFWPGTISYTPP